MKSTKLNKERDEIGQSWTQMELKETCGSIYVHHQTPRRRQGREKQLKSVKVDLMSKSKRQATPRHCHGILSGPVEEHIIILNVSLVHIPWKNKTSIFMHT